MSTEQQAKQVAVGGTPLPKAGPAPRTITLVIQSGWGCPECSTIYSDEDGIPPLRECSSETCGETFCSAERNCPQCNRPFSRKLADRGCEECNVELEEVEFTECPGCGERLKCSECEAFVGAEQ